MHVHAEPLETLRRRSSEKWVAHPADVLPLFVAEMDYPLADPIIERLVALARASDTGYASSPAPVATAFAAFADRTWGWAVDPAAVRTTTDVSVAIVETLRMAIRPGDGVVIMPPIYPPFFDLVPEAGGTVVQVPLVTAVRDVAADVSAGVAGAASAPPSQATAGSVSTVPDLRMDLAGIEAALAAGARAVLLCSPHNPLGLVHTRAELSALADLAARFGATVVSDEIHGPLTHDASFVPFLSVSDAAREVGICVTSASKTYNLAGLKCALMVADGPRGVALLDGMPYEVAFRTSLFGLHASTTAFAEADEWRLGVISSITDSARLLSGLLADHLPEVGYRPPVAGYLAWLDARALGWGDDPAARALEVARVALNSGLTFGTQGSGFLRLNLACAPDVLAEAVRRLAAAR